MINISLIEAIKDLIVSCMLSIECLRLSHRFRTTNWILSFNEMSNCCVKGLIHRTVIFLHAYPNMLVVGIPAQRRSS